MRKLGSIVIVFAGLTALMYAASMLSVVNVMAPFDTDPQMLAVAVLSLMPSLLCALLGVYLIYGRHSLAERWFDDDPLDVGIDALALLRVGLLLIGLSTLVRALADLMGTLALLALPVSSGVFTNWGHFAELAVSFALGTVLVVKSESLSDYLWRIGDRKQSRA